MDGWRGQRRNGGGVAYWYRLSGSCIQTTMGLLEDVCRVVRGPGRLARCGGSTVCGREHTQERSGATACRCGVPGQAQRGHATLIPSVLLVQWSVAGGRWPIDLSVHPRRPVLSPCCPFAPRRPPPAPRRTASCGTRSTSPPVWRRRAARAWPTSRWVGVGVVGTGVALITVRLGAVPMPPLQADRAPPCHRHRCAPLSHPALCRNLPGIPPRRLTCPSSTTVLSHWRNPGATPCHPRPNQLHPQPKLHT